MILDPVRAICVFSASALILTFSILATRHAVEITKISRRSWVSGYTEAGSFGYILCFFIFSLSWLLENRLLGLVSLILTIPSALADLKSSLDIYTFLRRELGK